MTPTQLNDLRRAIDFSARAANADETPAARAYYTDAATSALTRLADAAPLMAVLGGVRIEITKIEDETE